MHALDRVEERAGAAGVRRGGGRVGAAELVEHLIEPGKADFRLLISRRTDPADARAARARFPRCRGKSLALVEELERALARRVDIVIDRSLSAHFRPFIEAEARPL